MIARALVVFGILWSVLAQSQYFTVRVRVEKGNEPLLNATVTAVDKNNGRTYAFQLDSVTKAYVSKEVEHGWIMVRVAAPDCETEERFITICEDDKRRLEQRFVMGRQGAAFFYSDKLRYPFEERKQLLAVKILPDSYTKLEEWTKANGLSIIVEMLSNVGNVYGVVGSAEVVNAFECTLLASLRSKSWVEYAGVVINAYAVLTNGVAVRMVTSANLEAMEAFLKKQGLTIVNKISDTNWHCKAADSCGYKLNSMCKELVQHPEIEGVIPDMRELFFVGED